MTSSAGTTERGRDRREHEFGAPPIGKPERRREDRRAATEGGLARIGSIRLMMEGVKDHVAHQRIKIEDIEAVLAPILQKFHVLPKRKPPIQRVKAGFLDDMTRDWLLSVTTILKQLVVDFAALTLEELKTALDPLIKPADVLKAASAASKS